MERSHQDMKNRMVRKSKPQHSDKADTPREGNAIGDLGIDPILEENNEDGR